MAESRVSQSIDKFSKSGDLFLALGIAGILIGLLIPLPSIILDLALVFNISFAILILFVVAFTREVLDLNAFPSLLLFTAMMRLGLNVATTRKILLEAYGGEIIEAFGEFVVGGNFVVGLVIFSILVVIQFAVITKGSGRISEVAARFTLDAMPGKQMAIDADLNSGIIDEVEARSRRESLEKEASFYGSMDGAAKFVRGDAQAGLIITFINILGGLFIGVFQHGMGWAQAGETYTILTVGDGLVAQIPSIIISLSAGIIVSRANKQDRSLGESLTIQMIRRPEALKVTALMLLGCAIVPGLPTIPFLTLSVILGTMFFNFSKKEEMDSDEAKQKEEKADKDGPESVEHLLIVDPMELEIGYGLIPIVDSSQKGDILSRIGGIRKQAASQLGIIVPPIRIRDNMQLKPNEYNLKINGVEKARSEIYVNSFLAMNSGVNDIELPGIKTQEPSFGLPAVWISEGQKSQAEAMGFTVVDAASVLATHISEIINRHAADLLTRQDVQTLIDNFKKQNSAVVNELLPNLLTLGGVHRVMQNLLKEGIPVIHLGLILETLADHASKVKDVDILTEYVRMTLKEIISKKFIGMDNSLAVITIDGRLEQKLSESIQQNEYGSSLALDPELAVKLVQSMSRKVELAAKSGYQPAILCSPQVRLQIKRLIERQLQYTPVLSYNEISNQITVKNVGVVQFEEVAGQIKAA